MAKPRIADSTFWPQSERAQAGYCQTPALQSSESSLLQPSQAVLQDRFWHNRYHLEPYYVSGRGYDQYQPAYELGWTAAEKYLGDFAAIRPLLEAQWASHSGASLLDWRQVAGAAQAAWERMRSTAPGLSHAQLLALVQELQRLNLEVVNNLRLVVAQAPYGFEQLLLRCQLRGFESASRELACAFDLPAPEAAGSFFAGAWQRGWEAIKAAMGQCTAPRLLEASEQAEKMLLQGYGAALRQGLPETARALLQRQSMAVQRGIEALHWLRASQPG